MPRPKKSIQTVLGSAAISAEFAPLSVRATSLLTVLSAEI